MLIKDTFRDAYQVGVELRWSSGRVTVTFRNRWQGSRDLVKLTRIPRVTRATAESSTELLISSAEFSFDLLKRDGDLRRGAEKLGWRVTSTGQVVR